MATTAHQLNAPRSLFVWHVAAPSLAASLALFAIAALAATSVVTAQNESQQALKTAVEAMESAKALEAKLQQVREVLAGYVATGNDQVLGQLNGLRTWRLEIPLPSDPDRAREILNIIVSIQRELATLLATDTSQERRVNAQQLMNEISLDLLKEAHEQQVRSTDALAVAIRSNELTTWTLWMVVLLGIAGAGAGALAVLACP